MEHQFAQSHVPWDDQPLGDCEGQSSVYGISDEQVVSEWNTCNPQYHPQLEKSHPWYRPGAQAKSDDKDLIGVRLEDSTSGFI